jgi:uncharacterized membrane protein
MLPTWGLLGIGGVLLAVGGTLFDKYLLSKYFGDHEGEDAGPGALVIFSAYFSIVIIAGLVFFNSVDFNFTPQSLAYSFTAGILNGLWILLYLKAIHRTSVSKAAPLMQTIPAFGLILAYISLGEVLTPEQLIAMVILLFGAIVLMQNRNEDSLGIDYLTFGLMLSSAFFVALSQTFFKIATTTTDYFSATLVLWVGFLFFGILLHVGVRSYRKQFNFMFAKRIKSVFSFNAANEVFDSVGELLFFAAIMVGPLALVQSLNAYEPFLILVISSLLTILYPKYFSESLTKYDMLQKTFGVLIVLLGSIILYQNI